MISREPYQVRISGRGGQGVILAGVLLAEAGMNDGLCVVHTQSYGPEARLGAATSEVILARTAIAYPQVTRPDLLVCLSRDAYSKYGAAVAPGGLVLVDERAVDEVGPAATVCLPFGTTAVDAGDVIAANVVALGAIVGLSDVVSEEAVRRSIRSRVRPAFLELNERAFAGGLALGRAVATVRSNRQSPSEIREESQCSLTAL